MKTLISFLLALSTLAPIALGATPDREYDAANCEVFVNTLELEQWHYGGGGYDEQFFKVWISVDKDGIEGRQGGKILQVGMRLNGQDDIVSAREFEPAYYMLRQSLWERGYETRDYVLTRFAVFVDVLRADGRTDRLWLKDGWHDFNWPEVFDGYPIHRESLGSQYHQYLEGDSPVYARRNACRR